MSKAQTILERVDAGIREDVNLLVARVHRYDAEPERGKPSQFGWHLLLPQEGAGYPFHMTVLGLIDNNEDTRVLLALALKRGMHEVDWQENIPVQRRAGLIMLRDFLIDQVAPLEFQKPMHDGNARYLSRLTVLTTGKGLRGKWAVQT
jgi:hypothetical protein